MTQAVMKFEKVCYDQFVADCVECGWIPYLPIDDKELDAQVRKCYDNIKLPERSTSGSAGYDFYFPFDDMFFGNEECIVPTGIRCSIDSGWMLMLCPRSSLGFKYGMRLMNTVGIIDSDYYYADNQGHIMAKIKVDKRMDLKSGDRFMQGIAIPYGITVDDHATETRTGGFGSTDKRSE